MVERAGQFMRQLVTPAGTLVQVTRASAHSDSIALSVLPAGMATPIVLEFPTDAAGQVGAWLLLARSLTDEELT